MLSEEQMIILARLVDYAMRLLLVRLGIPIELSPPQLIVHGGGGVGKSFLINLVAMWIEKILRLPGDHPLKPKILIMAFTGK